MIYRRPGFLAVVWFGSTPFSLLPSAMCLSFSVFPLCRRWRPLMVGGEMVGELPNHTTASKPGPLYSKAFNTLWYKPSACCVQGGRTRELCDKLSDAGYMVLLPDFFRGESRVSSSSHLKGKYHKTLDVRFVFWNRLATSMSHFTLASQRIRD